MKTSKYRLLFLLIFCVLVLFFEGCMGTGHIEKPEEAQKQLLTVKNLINHLTENWNSTDTEAWHDKYVQLIKMAAKCKFNYYEPDNIPSYCKYLAEEAGILGRKGRVIGSLSFGYKTNFLKKKYTSGKPLILYSTYFTTDSFSTSKLIVDAILVKKILNVPVYFVLPEWGEGEHMYPRFMKKVHKILEKRKFPMCLISDVSVHVGFLETNISITRYTSPTKGIVFKVQCYLPLKNKDFMLEKDFPIYQTPYPCNKPTIIKLKNGEQETLCSSKEIDPEKISDALPFIKWMYKEIDLRRKYENQ